MSDRPPTTSECLRALELASCLIMKHEPGDSRAVSDEAVAIAAVSSGFVNDEVIRIIDAALERERS